MGLIAPLVSIGLARERFPGPVACFMCGMMVKLPNVRSMGLADAICQAATTQTDVKSSKSGIIFRN